MAGEGPVTVGVVGCGKISEVYLRNCDALPNLRLVACADLDPRRAQLQAEEFGVPWAGTVEELLEDDSIEVILNLTVPLAHVEITLRSLNAGKHVYSEKPLATDTVDGRRILRTAERRGRLVACAPDTFLGGAWQACRRVLDQGGIGRPVAASAFMMGPGHESWHPDPDFFYAPGGGPMLDMGPYYLTALVALLGPVRRVTGSAFAASEERTITSHPRYGQRIKVTTPTHIAGVLDFVGGAVGTIVTSFDVPSHSFPPLEIYGTEGTLYATDPNHFQGEVRVQRVDGEWREVWPQTGPGPNLRGIGLADLATSIRTGSRPRAGAQLAYHVLDIMQSFFVASDEGRHVVLDSTCDRPEPLPSATHDIA